MLVLHHNLHRPGVRAPVERPVDRAHHIVYNRALRHSRDGVAEQCIVRDINCVVRHGDVDPFNFIPTQAVEDDFLPTQAPRSPPRSRSGRWGFLGRQTRHGPQNNRIECRINARVDEDVFPVLPNKKPFRGIVKERIWTGGRFANEYFPSGPVIATGSISPILTCIKPSLKFDWSGFRNTPAWNNALDPPGATRMIGRNIRAWPAGWLKIAILVVSAERLLALSVAFQEYNREEISSMNICPRNRFARTAMLMADDGCWVESLSVERVHDAWHPWPDDERHRQRLRRSGDFPVRWLGPASLESVQNVTKKQHRLPGL